MKEYALSLLYSFFLKKNHKVPIDQKKNYLGIIRSGRWHRCSWKFPSDHWKTPVFRSEKVFSCKYWKIFKNNFFYRTTQVATSKLCAGLHSRIPLRKGLFKIVFFQVFSKQGSVMFFCYVLHHFVKGIFVDWTKLGGTREWSIVTASSYVNNMEHSEHNRSWLILV